MRLIRFGAKDSEKPGIILNKQRHDCSKYFSDWNREFFQNNGLDQLRSLIEKDGNNLPLVDTGERWGSPIPRPGMILCVGLNYSDHAREAGMEPPEKPVLFMKAANTISGPNDPVSIPKNSTKTDWEVELGIVLQKDTSYLGSEEDARDHIAGFCVVHDVSERKFQLEEGGQWVKGKSCPGFSPVGPYLVTTDEIPNVQDLGMQLSVNGVPKQNGNTSTMIFDPFFLVHYISQYMLLEAGDLISTGTPPGVGLGMNPPQFLSAGDRVSLSIDHLGSQEQEFVA